MSEKKHQSGVQIMNNMLQLKNTTDVWFETTLDTKFLDIIYDDVKVGEIEYDEKSKISGGELFEIVSIYIENDYRKLKLGKKSVYAVFELFNIDKLSITAANTALKFWKSFNHTKVKKDVFIIKKKS